MIEQFAKKHNLPKYRVVQFNQKYYKEYISSFDELTTWSKDLREILKKEISFSKLIFQSTNYSENRDTQKVLFKTERGNYVESVLIKE